MQMLNVFLCHSTYHSFNTHIWIVAFIPMSRSEVLINTITLSEALTFDLLLCQSALNSSLSLCSKVKNKKLYLATFASVLGPMSFGFVLGYSSPAIPELTSIDDPRLRLNSDQASWFGV